MSDPTLAALAGRIRAAVPADMLSMSRWFPDQRQLERVLSTDPAAYPVAGRKDKPPSPWSDQVLRDGQPHVAADAAAIERHFDDHAWLVRHGVTSILNVPVVAGGACVGTINLMRGGTPYTMADAAQVLALIPPGTAAALHAAQLAPQPKEVGGPAGPEPTRFGDWEQKGRCTDF